ncbi:MAG TPA: hypothetical protein DEB74_16835, partial [Lachnospiraceae bacterium]|nr:hypothetical protein [Lachnospiraceae bacterium]
ARVGEDKPSLLDCTDPCRGNKPQKRRISTQRKNVSKADRCPVAIIICFLLTLFLIKRGGYGIL